jgi:hypothetical protein
MALARRDNWVTVGSRDCSQESRQRWQRAGNAGIWCLGAALLAEGPAPLPVSTDSWRRDERARHGDKGGSQPL